MTVRLTINGRAHELGVEGDAPTLWVLREEVGLTGPKFGCGMALCGACTVLVDGQPTRSCVTPLAAVAGRRLTTVEGLEGRVAEAVRRAWIELDVAQCGYCQPGQVIAATVLLTAHPQPTEAQVEAAMNGHLCRCGTYPRIRAAIAEAARSLA
jgi:aerobic-type carbon monoxide dehydrogenase small subunit (CoxS/CutS family)